MSYEDYVRDFKFLLSDALSQDEKTGGNAETVTKFTDCLEAGLKARSFLQKSDSNHQKVSKLINNALVRAEEIKTRLNPTIYPNIGHSNSVPSAPFITPITPEPVRSTVSTKPNCTPKPTSSLKPKLQTPEMTREEIKLLLAVSTVNGQTYLPFSPNDVTTDKFKSMTPYTDRTKLKLSQSMSKIPGVTWERIDELYTNPVIFNEHLSAASLKQGSIGDCSLICSMAVSADYEFRRFPRGHPSHVPLLSRIIHPQNSVNTNGKYVIELRFNGCKRAVVIDNKIPVGPTGRMLTCSATFDKRKQFLPVLVEKAYMKMMGGYDFPGSNSGVDMHTLFGWIPERVDFTPGETIKVGTDGHEFSAKNWFDNMLLPRFQQGACLVTISTSGDLPADKQALWGLEEGHAYAVLDLRKTKCGLRMIKVKNPWAKDRFKGRWSPYDAKNWTKDLQIELNYNIFKARDIDDGIFWLDYDAARTCFDNLWLAWKPEFICPRKNQFSIHANWNSGGAPVKDRYFMTKNPQYKLIVTGQRSKLDSSSIWLLLTRHITDRRDFETNSVYLGLIVYANNKRIYAKTMVKRPIFDGIRINSPHYLVKLKVPEMMKLNESYSEAVVVITQYENKGASSYTLVGYPSPGVDSLSLTPIYGPDDCKYREFRIKFENKIE